MANSGQEVYVRLKGIDQLAEAAGKLVPNVKTTAPQRFQMVAELAARRLASSLPTMSGRLASSAHGWATPMGANVGHGAGIPYAGWIDFGGGHDPQHAARPYVPGGRYIGPVVEDVTEELLTAAGMAANDAIGKTDWPKGGA